MKTILLVAGVFAVAVIFAAIIRPAEPAYHSKTVSFWLDQIAAGTGDWTEITNAFYQIGPKAVPFVAARLKRDRSWPRRSYRQAWAHLPGFLRRQVSPPSDPFKEVSAVNAFEDIGPSAIPSLTTLLKDNSAVVRSASAWALESLRRSGHGDEVTICALANALSDPDATVRCNAARALGEFGPKANMAIPALTARLKDDDKGAEQGSIVFVRAAAARALGRIGPSARETTPILTNLLNAPQPYLRMEATIALWRINHRASEEVTLLIDELAQTADPSKWEIFQALGEMGPDAKEAVSVVAVELKSRQSEVRQRAAEALWKIDPGQAPIIVPALVEALENSNATSADLFSVVTGVKLLGEIGPEARGAVPALLKLMNDPYPDTSNAVARALVQIDPEAAAKAGIRQ